MPFSPFSMMQHAVDIVGTSHHPTNKIAATLAGVDQAGQPYHLSAVNFWPEPILQHFGIDQRIGGSSGTVHAETACVVRAPKTKGAQLFITDPPCPNCVKNVAEAGIKEIYIDHKGFDKDFAHRRGDEFASMALRICQRAGISVYRLFRKEQRLESILGIDENFKPPLEKAARFDFVDGEADQAFKDFIAREGDVYEGRPFALCLARDGAGARHRISAETHPVIGFTGDKALSKDGKYTYVLEPLNRLLMTAARKGWKILPEFVFSSRVPTARELVNFIGAGYRQLYIADATHGRDEQAVQALGQLQGAQILDVRAF
jgi:dCMP deaminase